MLCIIFMIQIPSLAKDKENEIFPYKEYQEFKDKYEYFDPYLKVFVLRKYKEEAPRDLIPESTYQSEVIYPTKKKTVVVSKPKENVKQEPKSNSIEIPFVYAEVSPTEQVNTKQVNQINQNNQIKDIVRIAIIPMINATAEKHPYLDETANKEFEKLSLIPSYQIISQEEINRVLAEEGWSSEWLELPEKEVLMNVARKLKADYVISTELSDIRNWYSQGFMTSTAKSEVRIKCKAIVNGKYQVVSGVNRGQRKISNIQLSFGGSNLGSAMVRGVRKSIDDCLIKVGLINQEFLDELENKESAKNKEANDKIIENRNQSRK